MGIVEPWGSYVRRVLFGTSLTWSLHIGDKIVEEKLLASIAHRCELVLFDLNQEII